MAYARRSPRDAVLHADATSNYAAAIVDLSRTRQALLSVAQPALAAVLALGTLPSAQQIVLGLVAATTGYLAVFSLNDVLDRKADAAALSSDGLGLGHADIDTVFVTHPIARGHLPVWAAWTWVGSLSAVSAVCAWLLAPACLALFALAVVLEAWYCSLRSVTWAKTFVSGVMVAVGGLAGWVAVARLSVGAIPVFAFLAAWEIAGRNLPNDLTDADIDGAAGIRTVATTFGPKVSARWTLVGAEVTAALALLLPIPWPARVLAVACVAWAMVLPGIRLTKHATRSEAGAYFNRASLLPALVLATALFGVLIAR